MNVLIIDISIYASESYSETMVEAFSDYFLNDNSAHEISKEIKRIVDIKLRGVNVIMHLMPSWYPYIDWDKSDMKVTVLKSDTPQEIKDEFAKYLEELKKPKKGFVDK